MRSLNIFSQAVVLLRRPGPNFTDNQAIVGVVLNCFLGHGAIPKKGIKPHRTCLRVNAQWQATTPARRFLLLGRNAQRRLSDQFCKLSYKIH
jgi:phage gpG-like protein